MTDSLTPDSRLRSALNTFSLQTPAGTIIQICGDRGTVSTQPGTSSTKPLTANTAPTAPRKATKAATKPCNLTRFAINEPKANPQGKDGSRTVHFERTQTRLRRQSPIVLRTGSDCFQVTAPSKRQGSRQVVVNLVEQAWCGLADHQSIRVRGPNLDTVFLGQTANLALNRQPLIGDDSAAPSGLWTFVNACWTACRSPQQIRVESHSCGLPTCAGSAPMADLVGLIEVFPADRFKLSLTVPAMLEPSALKLESKSDMWKTDKDREIESDKATADSYFQSNKEFLKEASITRGDVRDFVSDMRKKSSGDDDEHFVDKLAIEFSQTDGTRVVKAPIDDAIKLVRAIRSAEYAIKQIDKWVESACIGPGASFSISCQFFAGSLSAEWGQVEYVDDRVFFGWSGSLDIELIKLELKIAIGWRCAGLADLFIELGGEGALGITASAAARGPDDDAEMKVSPKGELKLSGLIKTQLMWAVKGETGLECTFKADFDDFHFVSKKGAISGKITIVREPVYRVITYSNRLFGGTTTSKETIVEADEQLAVFIFAE